MATAAVLIYWVIVAVWLSVLGTVVYFYVRNPRAFGTTRVLLAVLAIDTVRNVVENIYFGFYFGGRYGFFPESVVATLGQPHLLIVPKVLNVVAGVVVLSILLMRWLPHAARERRALDDQVDHLGELAATDALTGLANRRHFTAHAEAEIVRCRRYHRPLALLMLDIDHFKSINDSYGHDIGDRAIVELARACQSRMRATDVLGRLGGEEFGVLLPETDLDAARAVAEGLREAVAAIRIDMVGGDLAYTVSIGVAPLVAGGTFDTVAKQADRALYDAKRGGRDRVCVCADANA